MTGLVTLVISLLAGVVLLFLPSATWLDPVSSLVVAAVIVTQAAGVFRSSIAVLLESKDRKGYDLVKNYWTSQWPAASKDNTWKKVLNDGVLADTKAPEIKPTVDGKRIQITPAATGGDDLTDERHGNPAVGPDQVLTGVVFFPNHQDEKLVLGADLVGLAIDRQGGGGPHSGGRLGLRQLVRVRRRGRLQGRPLVARRGGRPGLRRRSRRRLVRIPGARTQRRSHDQKRAQNYSFHHCPRRGTKALWPLGSRFRLTALTDLQFTAMRRRRLTILEPHQRGLRHISLIGAPAAGLYTQQGPLRDRCAAIAFHGHGKEVLRRKQWLGIPRSRYPLPERLTDGTRTAVEPSGKSGGRFQIDTLKHSVSLPKSGDKPAGWL